jgi:uncharacterized membrane protein
MRVFTTRAHGIVDYGVGALLIASPWVFGFAGDGAETWVPVLLGLALLAYSAFTDYELGLVKRIQMPIHLWLDAVGGLLLAVSPWLLSFDDRVWVPHLVVGLAEMLVAFVTDTIPGYERRGAARATE